MPERTEQTRAKPPLDQRVREALDALDTAFTKLSDDGEAVSEAELAEVESQAEQVVADGPEAALEEPLEESPADEPVAAPWPAGPPADVESIDETFVEDIEEVLGEDIDALLAAVDTVVEEIDQEASEEGLSGEGPAPESTRAVERFEGDASEDTPPEAESEVDAEAESEVADEVDPVPAEAIEEVDPVLAEAINEIEQDPPAEPPSIEELDDELAGLAESIVEGDFEDAEGNADAASPPVVSRVEETPAEDVAEADDAATESGSESSPASEAPAAADGSEEPAAAPKTPSSSPGKARGRRTVRGALAPVGARVLLLIAKPTAGLSTSTRDTIGWLGLYSAFLAICVWGFVLFFRKPIAPLPTAEAVNISGTANERGQAKTE